MKRQKRDKEVRAFKNGKNAGLHGHSSDFCPYSDFECREFWLGGWREGWEHFRSSKWA